MFWFFFPAEVCRIFASYGNRVPGNPSIAARRRSTYTRSYFCLSKIDQTTAPTREEKEFLSAAGIGEQRITFFGNLLYNSCWLMSHCYIPSKIFVIPSKLFYRWWSQCRGILRSYSGCLPKTKWLWRVWAFKSFWVNKEQKALSDTLPKDRVYHKICQDTYQTVPHLHPSDAKEHRHNSCKS